MKALSLIIPLLYITTITQAQLCEKTDCDKLKDYCNARITKAYIESYLEHNNQDLPGYQKIRNKIFANITIESPPDYEIVSTALAEGFRLTKEKLTDRIHNVAVRNLDEPSAERNAKIFIDRIDSAISQDIKGQLKGYEDLKSELQRDLAKQFEKFIPGNEQPEEVKEPSFEAQPKPSQKEHTDNENIGNLRIPSKGIFAGLDLWTILLLTLNILLLGLTVYNYRQIRRTRRDRSHKTSGDGARSSEKEQLARDVHSLRSNTDSNKREIDEIKQKVNEITARLSQRLAAPPRIEPQETSASTNGVDQSTTFYMAFPVGNYFSNKGRSNSKADTFYTFEVNPGNRNEASFRIHAGEAMIKEYIAMAEECIKPACQEENIASSGVKHIKNVRAGTAVLEDDKWIIKTKAVIRYE